MEGLISPPEQRGIIPKTFDHIFKHIGANTVPTKQFMVRCSYLEIYNEEIRDLLSKDPEARLELKEDADHFVYVKDLTAQVVKTSAEMEKVLSAGRKNRVVGATLMNATSSRSHAVFSITMETAETGSDGKQHFKVGKMNLVDLAGSERQSKTGATGQRLKEATKINQSLMALGNVISALVDGKSTHVPYRDSKLTRLLQDSLGGNTKTVMIANCGPADYNHDETLSTLRYADRAKQIRNKPKVNEDPKDALLKQFQEEITKLKAALAEKAAAEAAGGGAVRTMVINGKEVEVPAATVVERVVERVVGASEEEMRAMREKAQAEREELVAKAEKERRELLLAAASDAEERKRIERELAARHEEAERERSEKKALEEKLMLLQGKLLVGGEVLDKAAKQEEELKRAQLELEERRLQEAKMARELEEANVMIEDQYGTMAEEVSVGGEGGGCARARAGSLRAFSHTQPLPLSHTHTTHTLALPLQVAEKTRKLKKVWNKLQAATAEIQDARVEFQREREDYAEELRFLRAQLKLKQLLLDNFVPEEEQARLEARAKWDEETEDWVLGRLELAGNRQRMRRPPSTLTPAYASLYAALPMPVARPVAQHTLAKAQMDSDPRFRADNIATMDLEWGAYGHPPSDKLKVVGLTNAVVAGGGGTTAGSSK